MLKEGSAASARKERVPSGQKGTETPEPSAAERTTGSAVAQGTKAPKKGKGTPGASVRQAKSQENISAPTAATQATTPPGDDATLAPTVPTAGAQVRTEEAHENLTQQHDCLKPEVLGSNDVIRLLAENDNLDTLSDDDQRGGADDASTHAVAPPGAQVPPVQGETLSSTQTGIQPQTLGVCTGAAPDEGPSSEVYDIDGSDDEGITIKGRTSIVKIPTPAGTPSKPQGTPPPRLQRDNSEQPTAPQAPAGKRGAVLREPRSILRNASKALALTGDQALGNDGDRKNIHAKPEAKPEVKPKAKPEVKPKVPTKATDPRHLPVPQI